MTGRVLRRYKYSEIFYSFQGEGHYTGKMTSWLRFFLCNLQCNGFGQIDPTDESNYVLPYLDLDVSQFERMEDLPVFDHGCDSSYSWSAKFKHLQYTDTAEDICNKILKLLPEQRWTHPITGNNIHHAFTGGEPLMKHSQPAIIEMMEYWESINNFPLFITIETNGTQPLSPEFINWAKHYQDIGGEIFFSVSPKLRTVSGEFNEKAIHPEVVSTYFNLSPAGQLKFVVRNNEQCFQELDSVVKQFKNAGVSWNLYGMPVGATKESQESDDTSELAVKLINRGFHLSGRLHTHIFGNKVGT